METFLSLINDSKVKTMVSKCLQDEETNYELKSSRKVSRRISEISEVSNRRLTAERYLQHFLGSLYTFYIPFSEVSLRAMAWVYCYETSLITINKPRKILSDNCHYYRILSKETFTDLLGIVEKVYPMREMTRRYSDKFKIFLSEPSLFTPVGEMRARVVGAEALTYQRFQSRLRNNKEVFEFSNGFYFPKIELNTVREVEDL